MHAPLAYKKGDRVNNSIPVQYKFCFTSKSSTDYCNHCISMLDGERTDNHCSTCRVSWCKELCKIADTDHHFLCTKLYSEFRRFCSKEGHSTVELAARMFVSLLSVAILSTENQLSALRDNLLKSIRELESTHGSGSAVDESFLVESHYLFTTALEHGSDINRVLLQEALPLPTWAMLISIIKKYAHPVYIEHPAKAVLKEISSLPDTSQRHSAFLAWTVSVHSTVEKTLDPLEIERLLVHTVQLIDTDASPLRSMGYHAVGIPASVPCFKHSCAPNLSLEAIATEEGLSCIPIAMRDISANEELSITYIPHTDVFWTERSVELEAIFGLDFSCDCIKCVFERAAGTSSFTALHSPRKIKELHTRLHALTLQQRIHLAHVYMQEQQFTVVLCLCRLLLLENDAAGDVYHLMGAALLSMNHWRDAYQVWRAGVEKHPSHKQLQAEVTKCEAFISSAASTLRDAVETIAFDELRVTKFHSIFVSTAPIIDKKGCNFVVSTAEAYAASGPGWTKSRHYAVPTTDIPINAVPALLEWFNKLMSSQLSAILATWFSKDASVRVYVHDAFVVKYQINADGTSQRALPLHTDESTHSFILALNSCSDYEGGGTYFIDLKRTIRADAGHIVAFPGGTLEHGGDPLLTGTRYIIAAFLYIEKECVPGLYSKLLGNESAGDDVGKQDFKRIKFAQESDPAASAFQFGFSL